MLKLGRYPPQKIQSSHLKVLKVWYNGNTTSFGVSRPHVKVLKVTHYVRETLINFSRWQQIIVKRFSSHSLKEAVPSWSASCLPVHLLLTFSYSIMVSNTRLLWELLWDSHKCLHYISQLSNLVWPFHLLYYVHGLLTDSADQKRLRWPTIVNLFMRVLASHDALFQNGGKLIYLMII